MSTNPPAEYELASALKELLRLRAELATARAEIEELELNNRNARADAATACRERDEALERLTNNAANADLERDEARRTVERLRAALERIAKCDAFARYDDPACVIAREALDTTPSAEPVGPHPPAEATVRKP